MSLNYAGLVKLLLALRQLPDAAGETVLTLEEAAKIQSLGFDAAPGRWKVPPLPPELVRGNPILEPLAADRDPFWIPRTDPSPILTSVSGRGPERPSWQHWKTAVTPQTPAMETRGRRDQRQANQRSMPAPEQGTDWELVKKLASKIPAAVERAGGEIDRRRLQQKFWRYPAAVFNPALRLAAGRGRVVLDRK